MAELGKEKIEIFLAGAFVDGSEQLQVMESNQLKAHCFGDAKVAPDIVRKQFPLIYGVGSQRPERFAVHAREFLCVEILAQRGVRKIAGPEADGGRAERNRFAVRNGGLLVKTVPGDK